MAFAEELAFGLTTERPVARLREYLTVLRAVRDERTVDFDGAELTAVDPKVLPVALAGSAPFPIYVAAMGPKMLRVTAELADGTLPAGTGPRTMPSSDRLTRSLRGYLDAGADEVVLLPVQTDPSGLRRVYDIAAALETGG